MPKGARKSGTEINQNVNRLKRSSVEEFDRSKQGRCWCAPSSAHLEKVPEIPRLRSE